MPRSMDRQGLHRLDRINRGPRRRVFGRMSGTPDQIVSRLKEWEAARVGYAIVYFPDAAYDALSIELFAREVKPQFN